jgi:hypothetical protein
VVLVQQPPVAVALQQQDPQAVQQRDPRAALLVVPEQVELQVPEVQRAQVVGQVELLVGRVAQQVERVAPLVLELPERAERQEPQPLAQQVVELRKT